jgi:hypothetical protein
MKKYLLLTLTLLLCASLFSCAFNFNEELIFGDPEVPSADINKPTEEQTQIPTEEPTEKPTDPIITIDGITFDKTLKNRLDSASTYADICEILGKEGTLVEAPDVVYFFYTKQNPHSHYLYIKFENTSEGFVVCEDIKVTNDRMKVDLSDRDPEILEQLTIGKSFKEVQDITGHWGLRDHGMPIVYEWDFGDNVNIRIEFGNSIKNDKDHLDVLHMALWDYENTRTIADINREKLKLGQSIADINEMFGQKGKELASGNAYIYEFEDGKSLRVSVYCEGIDPSLPIEENYKFAGSAYIIDN